MNELFDEQNAGPAVLEVDRLLSEFYRAEMPDPWPRLRLPQVSSVRRSAPAFARDFRRLALAASVVLALFGYWVLAGTFAHPVAGGPAGEGPEIGHHQPVKHRAAPMERQRTPAGKDAQLFEEDTPGGVVINIIGPSSSKGPR